MKFGGHSALLLAVLSIVSRHKPIRAAFPADVLSRMDTTVDPCDDFQKYSCGTWTKSAVIAPDQTRVDASYQILYADADAAVEQIVQEKLPYIGEFWSSCMNTEQLDKLGASSLEPFLGKIIGAKDVAGVLVLGGQQRRNGNSFITDFDVSNDQKNGSLNTLWVGAADLVLPDTSFYTDKPTFQGIEQAYRTYITTLMKLAGFGPGGKFQVYPSASNSTTQQQKLSAVNLTTIADKIIALEQTLAPWVPDTSNSANWTLLYNPISVADALRKYPVGFGKYAQGIGLFEKSTLKPTSMVAFNSFEYAANVEKWLGNVDVVDLKLYLAFCYINANVQYLSSAFSDAYFQLFGAAINGETAPSPRKSICIDNERNFFPDLIGKYYFQKKFDQKREDEAKSMVKLIEATMADHISKLTWLDDATRAAALTKLSKVNNLIGHSTENISYPFQLKNNAYFDNVYTLTSFGIDVALKQAGQPINPLHWRVSAAEVNAFYWARQNEVILPAAELQPPFFNGTSHPAQNFGAIGSIIGDELTAGFDTNGRLYDGDGNMVNWWDSNATAEFNKRAQCFVDEYNAFIMYGADGKALGRVNGTNTLNQNIGDNAGLSLSWDAYKQYMKTTSNMPTNGVLPEEADKLYFISNAQIWCMKYRDEAMVRSLASNVHAPYLARANGVVMNSEPFAKTFQCKAGSKMNPTTKCELW